MSKRSESWMDKTVDILHDIQLTTDKIGKISRELKPRYESTSKPYLRFEFPMLESDLAKSPLKDKKIICDGKWDGVRTTISRIGGRGYVFVDPADIKKDNDVSIRFPSIIKEVEQILPDDTVLDCELIAVREGEALHRTNINAIINSKKPPERLQKFVRAICFAVLYWKGEDIRSYPTHEMVEILQQIESSEHIKIEKYSTNLDDKSDGYIVNSKDFERVKKAIESIRDSKNVIGIKGASEGIVFKGLDGHYETPTNHQWAKGKWAKEADCRILESVPVKGSATTVNYLIGRDVDKSYAKALLSMSRKEWYHSIACLSNKRLYRGKDAVGKQGKWHQILGKTDNTKQKIEVGKIVRINPEEVLLYPNSKFPEYPRYKCYISRVLQPVPEKDSTDIEDVFERLSMLEPKRIPVDELLQNQAVSPGHPTTQEEVVSPPSGQKAEYPYPRPSGTMDIEPRERAPGEEVLESADDVGYKVGDSIIYKGKIGKIIGIK